MLFAIFFTFFEVRKVRGAVKFEESVRCAGQHSAGCGAAAQCGVHY